MVGGRDSSVLPTGVSSTERVKSGWYFTDDVAVIFGNTTSAFFCGSFFSFAFLVPVSSGFVAVFVSSCDGAVTEGFFTGSAAFSGFGAAFLGSAAAVFF